MLQASLFKRYGTDSGSPFILHVSFQVKAGITILFGPSGSGKTLTLKMVAGIEVPDLGIMSVNGECFFDSKQGICVPIRMRNVGYVFQNLALFPHLTVLQNVTYGLYHLGKANGLKRAGKALEDFQIKGLADRMPENLSGGEQQRVALARALVTEPKVLLLDEPLSALDMGTKRSIMADLNRINQKRQIPILYVTHDRAEALGLGEHLLLLEAGKVVAEGQPIEVLERPQKETIANLLGVENIFDAAIIDKHPERGTMTCDLGGCRVEVPYTDWPACKPLGVGLRSGDILLAVQKPLGVSAQNILSGKISSMEPFDYEVHLTVECGVTFKVTLTRNATESLHLSPHREVWIVFKTHSWHILR